MCGERQQLLKHVSVHGAAEPLRLARIITAIALGGALFAQDAAIRLFEERVKRAPEDGVNLSILGELYLRQARITGDLGAYSRAEDTLKRAAKILGDDPGIQNNLASLYYAEHRFPEAMELARSVYQRDPRFTQALVTVADSQLSLGRYEEAEKTYAELAAKPAEAPVLARLGYFKFLKGDTDEAIRLTEQALEKIGPYGEAREDAAWFEVRLAELLRGAGRLDEAEAHYRRAVETSSGYDRAMAEAGIGAIEAARGRVAEAIAAHERAVKLHPQPSLLAALGDLYKKAGRDREAERQFEAVRAIGRAPGLNASVYARELSMFYADHDVELGEALRLAREDWKARQDVYGADALGWALYKNGQIDEAAELAGKATRLGTRDAKLWYHAGVIWAAAGDRERAREALVRAGAEAELARLDEGSLWGNAWLWVIVAGFGVLLGIRWMLRPQMNTDKRR